MPESLAARDSTRRHPLGAVAAAAVFVLVALVAGVDAVLDLRVGVPPWSIAIDLGITAVALLAGVLCWWRAVALRHQASALRLRLAAARADADYWRAEAATVLPALGAAIQRQFERWTLTADEQQVALLLLNGFSTREIADIRHASIRTVREQTFAVYRKAGFSGRSALAAFFLQDLLFLAGHPATRAEEERPSDAAVPWH